MIDSLTMVKIFLGGLVIIVAFMVGYLIYILCQWCLWYRDKRNRERELKEAHDKINRGS